MDGPARSSCCRLFRGTLFTTGFGGRPDGPPPRPSLVAMGSCGVSGGRDSLPGGRRDLYTDAPSSGTVHVLPEVGILYHEISVDTLSLGIWTMGKLSPGASRPATRSLTTPPPGRTRGKSQPAVTPACLGPCARAGCCESRAPSPRTVPDLCLRRKGGKAGLLRGEASESTGPFRTGLLLPRFPSRCFCRA